MVKETKLIEMIFFLGGGGRVSGPFRQYFSLYQPVSQTDGEIGEKE